MRTMHKIQLFTSDYTGESRVRTHDIVFSKRQSMAVNGAQRDRHSTAHGVAMDSFLSAPQWAIPDFLLRTSRVNVGARHILAHKMARGSVSLPSVSRGF